MVDAARSSAPLRRGGVVLVLFKTVVAMAGCGVVGAVLAAPVYKFREWRRKRNPRKNGN